MVARLVAQVLDGHDAVVVGPGDSASFLQDVVPRLEDRGCRVFHVTAPSPGGLGLSALLAEVAGQPDLEAHDDDTLERGFQRLTVPGPGCDRIVLVIDGADRLHDPVFRYLALARKAADELQFVLAGQTDPTARPGEAVAPLHARLTAQPAFHIEPVPAGLPGPLLPASVLAGPTTDDASGPGEAPVKQDGHKQRPVWIVAALGMAVSAVIGFGVGRQAGSGDRTGTDAPAASTRTVPVNSPGQVGPAPVSTRSRSRRPGAASCSCSPPSRQRPQHRRRPSSSNALPTRHRRRRRPPPRSPQLPSRRLHRTPPPCPSRPRKPSRTSLRHLQPTLRSRPHPHTPRFLL